MPVNCRRCGSAKAEVRIPYAKLSLCPGCFRAFYIQRVRRTVVEFGMFRETDAVGVAVSGGKDSAALLHSLRAAFPQLRLVALHIDLGIPRYSEHCRSKVEALADLLNVELRVLELEKEVGVTVDAFGRSVYRRKLCSVCGTIKRHAFEELARRAGVRVLATGHNLDDMVGIMLNSFFSAQWAELARLKPVLEPIGGLSVKVKPLIKTPETESLLYCLYGDVPYRQIDCPHAGGTRTKANHKLLEALSRENPLFRYQALHAFLRLMPLLEDKLERPSAVPCRVCGFPSSDGTCAYCKRIAMVKGEPLPLIQPGSGKEVQLARIENPRSTAGRPQPCPTPQREAFELRAR